MISAASVPSAMPVSWMPPTSQVTSAMPTTSATPAVNWFLGLEKSTLPSTHMRTPTMPISPYSTKVTPPSTPGGMRSEEHTSELQSRFDLVCRLLLEKKQHN